jgi:REP element-mobilizing transposase RayT
MKYNPKIHHRRSIRLKGYDYSQAGVYFITICCGNRICRFGSVVGNEMILNEYGRVAYIEWMKLTERFINFELDVFQIMPNHLHGIIVLNDHVVGANLAVVQNDFLNAENENDSYIRAGVNPAPTIGDIVGGYKSLVANGCLKIYKSKNEPMGKLWQRNYHEHIIRNEQSYQTISNYIINNPEKWNDDKFFLK